MSLDTRETDGAPNWAIVSIRNNGKTLEVPHFAAQLVDSSVSMGSTSCLLSVRETASAMRCVFPIRRVQRRTRYLEFADKNLRKLSTVYPGAHGVDFYEQGPYSELPVSPRYVKIASASCSPQFIRLNQRSLLLPFQAPLLKAKMIRPCSGSRVGTRVRI